MIDDIIKGTIKEFCLEFLQSPYLCYTEHGLHALFYCRLYSTVPENEGYIQWEGKRVCIIQKEYPTAEDLDKSRRQHWDIAVLQSPPKSIPNRHPTYDYLILNSVIEFGMNASKEHLQEDIRRLSHQKSNVRNKYVIHLYRISDLESGRDWSPRSKQILTPDEVLTIVKGTDVDIYFGIADFTDNHESGLWQINNKGITKIKLCKDGYGYIV